MPSTESPAPSLFCPQFLEKAKLPARLPRARNGVFARGGTADDKKDVKEASSRLSADGEQLAVLIKKIYATPKPIVDRVTELIK